MTSSHSAGRRNYASLFFTFLVLAAATSAFGQLLYVPNNTATTVADFHVDPSTGALTAVSTPTTHSLPWDVAVSPNNKFVFVGEQAFIDSIVVAGDGTLGTPTPVATADIRGIVVDPSGKFVYASDASNSQIAAFSIDQTTGVLTPLAGFPLSTTAFGTSPHGMAVDAAGHLYVALSGGLGTIGQYSINATTGALTAIAGIASGLNTARVAVNPTGTLLFATNSTAGTVTAYTITGGTGALVAASSTLVPSAFPLGLTVHNNGQLLIVVDNAHSASNVFVYSIGAGAALTPVAGSPFTAGTAPAGVTVDPSGNFVYVSNSGSSNITKFTINTSTGVLTLPSTISAGTTATPLFLTSRPAPGSAVLSTVPSLSGWGMALLGMLLAASSLLLYRKAYR